MKKLILLATATLALASCDNNDNPAESSGAVTITATIGESTISRASDSKWDENDVIGISSTVGGVADPFINLKYTTKDGDGNFSGTPIFFYKPMTLTAYYPFTGGEGEAPGENGVISVKTDATAQENLSGIDFLWDSKKGKGVDKNQVDFSVSDPNVNFNFAHKMSKLTFTFLSSKPVYNVDNPDQMESDGVDVRTMVSYKIEGLGINGTFNTATGECAIDNETDREGLTIEFDAETVNDEDKYTYTRTFSPLIVFPQKKPDDKNFILHIKTFELKEGSPEQDYKCTLPFTDGEIKPGYHYKFNIQVSRRGLIIGELTIEPWESSEKFITATVDGGEGDHKIEEN